MSIAETATPCRHAAAKAVVRQAAARAAAHERLARQCMERAISVFEAIKTGGLEG
jgi:hypothetical protein